MKYTGPTKVISGGQKGADIAALRAAREMGIATGGFTVPPLMLDGRLDRFGMTVIDGSDDFALRSRRNVDASEATIAFMDETTIGTACTITYATRGVWKMLPIPQQSAPAAEIECTERGKRPVLRIKSLKQVDHEVVISAICAFLKKYNVRILNVCGSRSQEGKESTIQTLLCAAFIDLAELCPPDSSEESDV